MRSKRAVSSCRGLTSPWQAVSWCVIHRPRQVGTPLLLCSTLARVVCGTAVGDARGERGHRAKEWVHHHHHWRGVNIHGTRDLDKINAWELVNAVLWKETFFFSFSSDNQRKGKDKEREARDAKDESYWGNEVMQERVLVWVGALRCLEGGAPPPQSLSSHTTVR